MLSISTPRRNADDDPSHAYIFSVLERLTKAPEERMRAAESRNDVERRMYPKGVHYQSFLRLVCDDASPGWCSELTSKMVHQLPRELRDIIYTYILESRDSNRQHQVLMVDNPTAWNLAEFTSNPTQLGIRRFTIKGVEIPHFAVYEHVHETYRIELAETLYRTKLLRVASMHELKFTLNYDVLVTSCDPKEHIRRIQIELKFDCGTKTQAQYAKQLEPLWYLRHLKHLKGMKVGFIVHFIYDDVLPLLEEATAPLVQHLASEGARVGWYRKGRGNDAPSKVEHGTA